MHPDFIPTVFTSTPSPKKRAMQLAANRYEASKSKRKRLIEAPQTDDGYPEIAQLDDSCSDDKDNMKFYFYGSFKKHSKL